MTSENDYFKLIPWKKEDVLAGVLFILAFHLFFQIFFYLPRTKISITVARLLFFGGELPLLLAIWGLVGRKYGESLRFLGLRKINRDRLAQAFGLFLIIYFIDFFYLLFLKLVGPISYKNESKLLFQFISPPELIFLMGAIVIPLIEELFFRGFLFGGMVKRMGWKRAAFLSSLVFAFVHIVSPASVRFMPFYFGLGFGFAWLYFRTRSIVPSVIMHGLHNFVIYAVAYRHFISQDYL